MNERELNLWDRIGMWAIVAVCVAPLLPYALQGWGS
jgi:hypothetical protein